jgi:hypothetical protein
MQDKTIDNALLELRKRIIRGNGDGLEHVEALLSARGVSMPRVMPAKRKDASRRGLMRLVVLGALGADGARMGEIAAHVAAHRPELTYEQAYHRSGQCLARLKRCGMVRREGRVWSIWQ